MKSTAGASRDAEEATAICNKNTCLPRNTREKERTNLYCYIFITYHCYVHIPCTILQLQQLALKYTLRAKPNERENTALQRYTYTCTGE